MARSEPCGMAPCQSLAGRRIQSSPFLSPCFILCLVPLFPGEELLCSYKNWQKAHTHTQKKKPSHPISGFCNALLQKVLGFPGRGHVSQRLPGSLPPRCHVQTPPGTGMLLSPRSRARGQPEQRGWGLRHAREERAREESISREKRRDLPSPRQLPRGGGARDGQVPGSYRL